MIECMICHGTGTFSPHDEKTGITLDVLLPCPICDPMKESMKIFCFIPTFDEHWMLFLSGWLAESAIAQDFMTIRETGGFVEF